MLVGSLKEKLRQRILSASLVLQRQPHPALPFHAKEAGYNSLTIDMEHGEADLEGVHWMCHVAALQGITPLVRVLKNSPTGIAKVLDMGATGVIIPHVENADEARRAVSSARFPQKRPGGGLRGVSGPGLMTGYKFATANELNAQIVVIVMVESPAAINNCAEIAQVDGIDAVLVGSNDLTAELGVHGQFESAEYQTALTSIATACNPDVAWGIGGVYGNAAALKFARNLGATFFFADVDKRIEKIGLAASVNLLNCT